MKPSEKPFVRVRDLDFESDFLTGSAEDYPVDPFDPGFDD